MDDLIRHAETPEFHSPCLIAAWPGMGSVALTAVHYLKEKLKATLFAELAPGEYFQPSGAIVSQQVIQAPEKATNKFYYYQSPDQQRDILFFLGSLQPVGHKEHEFARLVLQFAQSCGVHQIFTAAAAPSDMDYRDKPRVFAVPNNEDALKRLMELHVHFMTDGNIAGLNGLLISVAREMEMSGMCLLGEIPFFTAQIEFPKAAGSILEVLCKLIGVKVDFADMEMYALQKEKEIAPLAALLVREEDEEESKEDKDVHEHETEEAIPKSVRVRVEKMFKQAEFDGTYKSKMRLKEELDQWNLFDEYLDRFLDLFKKS
ncbi:PAC2 family protein [candidate division KSB1 bacterium]|nr:PAC2 family protein [candidate division KSB1 bacterium]